MIILRGCNIGHAYRYHRVLHDISLELRAGECFVLLGPNGSGKTTLIKIFATLLAPMHGKFEIMGKESRTHRAEVRRHLFWMGPQTVLYDDLTVEENIQFAMGLRGIVPERKAIRVVLDRVGMGPFAGAKSGHLSTGMQKRLALAKAVFARPSLLLLDEPYAALDEQGMTVMNDCIRAWLKDGAAVLMSSHDTSAAFLVAGRAGTLKNKGLCEIALTPRGVEQCGT